MITLRVSYARTSELSQNLMGQLVHGGLMVKVAPPPGLTLHDPVRLVLVAPDGSEVHGEGKVLQVLGPQAIAVSFPGEAIRQLQAMLAAQPVRDDTGAPPSRHEVLPEGPAPPAPTGGPRPAELDLPIGPPITPGAHPGSADKIQQALHGSKDERAAILRDKNKMLHSYVLRNPQITPEEILAIAKNALTAPELLQQIADRKEWLQRAAIALALARNPKTPQATGIRALDHVQGAEVRQMAKGVGAPPHIVQAARKKVLR